MKGFFYQNLGQKMLVGRNALRQFINSSFFGLSWKKKQANTKDVHFHLEYGTHVSHSKAHFVGFLRVFSESNKFENWQSYSKFKKQKAKTKKKNPV